MFVVVVLALSLAQSPGNAVAAQASSAQETPASANLSSSDVAQLQSKGEAGDASSQLALGRAYQDGNGVPQSDELAAKWYRKAAEQGNATAQNNLGIMYRAGSGVEKSKEEALKWYRKAARQGYASAIFNLGAAYYNGDGVAIDDSRSYAWFLLAKEKGSTSAPDAVTRAESELTPGKINEGLIDLGEMYERGEELPHDLGESVKWYRKAAERGDPDARIALAIVLIKRKDPQDYAEARGWCEQSAKRNENRGQYCLALIYHHGLGVERDIDRATKMYRQAARLGNALAMQTLGQIYATGENGQIDRSEAFVWFVGAALNGNQGALGEAVKLKMTMSKEDLARTDKKLKKSHIDPKKLDTVLQGVGGQ
jgi:TPR repeat protein